MAGEIRPCPTSKPGFLKNCRKASWPTLAEIGEEINASLNLDRVLAKTAALIKRLVDYEIFTVMLLDQRTQTLSNRFAVGTVRRF